jgi:serine/threonine protein kinase
MADKRASWAGKESPAEPPREKGDSQLRLVSPEAPFAEDSEPNDESPTIISKTLPHGEAGRDNSDLRGRTLAHYELLEPIGVGGMAAVLRARDTQLDRVVALKILPPENCDAENIRRFHQEARAAAKLDHENIARVFYCGEDQALHFIAFEYVEGDNLRTILERRGQLPCGEAIRYILQIATGLEHAASRGVVHRDIKPSNIIITPGGRAKVVDMGLARSLGPQADKDLTQSGVTLGTFDYISPEQALEPREADCRSDIYSLGCTFYHMLTGQPPVPEGTAAKKLQHHQHVAPLDPRQLNPDIPDEVARILGKMMAKNARDRYQRPIDLVQHLMQAANSLGESFGREPIFIDVQAPGPAQRRPLLMASLAVLGLAALLFVLSLAPQPPKKVTDPPKMQASGPPAAKIIPDLPIKVVAPTPASIRDENDFKLALERERGADDKITIALDNDIMLSGELKIAPTSALRPRIEIVGPEPKAGRPLVRLWLNLDKPPTEARAGLTIEGATVWFKNIAFEVVAADTLKSHLDVPVAAVTVKSDSVVDFDKCSFAQPGLRSDLPFIQQRGQRVVPAASLALEAAVKAVGKAPKVSVRDSYFATGQTALCIAGYGYVDAHDCAFHSLGSLVHLKGGGDPSVWLEHCSAYLSHGPAFRIDDETGCRLRVDYSLFSVPTDAAPAGDNRDLLRQTDSFDALKIAYKGQSNGYHNLNSLWVQPAKDAAADSAIVAGDDLKAFRQKIKLRKGFDEDSQFIPNDSPPFLNETAASDNWESAFELNKSVRELQTPPEKHLKKHTMLGIRRFLNIDMDPLPPLVPEPVLASDYKPAANEKVVDPDYKGNDPVYYDDLAEALAKVHAGDSVVVTLKPGAANKDFSLLPKDLEFDLTLKGFPGTTPTLKLEKTVWNDAYLFRLLEGKLILENLHLVLDPTRDGYTTMALVNMIGTGTCTIKNCTITLKPRDRGTPRGVPLSVVSVAPGEEVKAMMGDARPTLPASTIKFQDCFVRGEGDVVTLRGSRPVNIHANKSLFYTGGSLVRQLQTATKDITNPDAAISVKMRESAFFFVDPLLWVQAGKTMPRVQYPLRVEQADHCLFTTLADKPLVAFETPDVSEKSLPQFFDWKGQGNAYVHFDKAYLLEQSAPEDGLRMFHLDDVSWKESLERDGDSLFLPMGFKALPARPLSLGVPEDAVIRAESLNDLQPFFMQLPKFHLPKN